MEYLQQSYLFWPEYKGWLSRLLCCKLRDGPMTNIRPNIQPTRHHFTSLYGSTRAQGPTGSPRPSLILCVTERREREGPRKKFGVRVDIQNAHFTQEQSGLPNLYVNPVNTIKKESFLVTSFWPPCDRLTDYFSFSGFWQCFPAPARPLPSLLRIY